MSEPTKPSSENSIILKSTLGFSRDSEKDLAVLSWISEQLTVLAEGFGEPLTAERVEIYAGGLIDVPRERLKVAFHRALQELTWFPKLADLRNLAGAKTARPKQGRSRCGMGLCQ